MKQTIRIGAGQGFYGDTLVPAIDIAKHGNVDYICFDALAELTLAILQKDRQKKPDLGYAQDIGQIARVLLPITSKSGTKLITNAGGMNPQAAARQVKAVAEELGLHQIKVAVVTGDDISGQFEDWGKAGVSFANMETNAPFEQVRDRLLFANAYLGAGPIVEALRQGADVVITGRVADAAVFMAPMIHEFGWSMDDWDKLAQAALIGHIMECSGQAAGGNFSGDWWNVDMVRPAFPMVDVQANGDAVFCKLPDSGGRISFDTIKEQVLYEVHDPAAYITPDVVADFTTAVLKDCGENLVSLKGTRGRPRTDTYKVVMGYENGYLAQSVFGYSWPDAMLKAQKAESVIRAQVEKLELDEYRVDYIGQNAIFGDPAVCIDSEQSEVWTRIAVRTADKRVAAKFQRLHPPLSLSGPPNRAGFGGKFPVRQLIGVWPTLVPSRLVAAQVSVEVLESANA